MGLEPVHYVVRLVKASNRRTSYAVVEVCGNAEHTLRVYPGERAAINQVDDLNEAFTKGVNYGRTLPTDQ